MLRKKIAFFVFLVITGFPAGRSVHEPQVVGNSGNSLEQTSVDKAAILSKRYPEQPNGPVPIPSGEHISETGEHVFRRKRSENEAIASNRRYRRQTQGTSSILQSVSQECDGVTLSWIHPNIPYSSLYHNDNPEFSHYNIYRKTSSFTSVVGLKPIASGKYHIELQNIATNKWTDKFPPTSTGLFYAVTIVNHRGKETQNVTPKQVTFYGVFEKTGIKPTTIVPNIIKGDVLHHSVAYNSLRNEYMVAFDTDVNKDGKPDHVYALRVNGLGQIADNRILNATANVASTEQGRPSVAFNPVTSEYLIVFQVSAASLFGGVSIIVGQRVFSDRTDRKKNPYLLFRPTIDSITYLHCTEPKIVYNSGSGGFAMTFMLAMPPKTAFSAFLNQNGDLITTQALFKGDAFDANVFMDTKNRQIYFVYQVAQWAATLTGGKHRLFNSYTYLILETKTNSSGGVLKSADSTRFLVGFTREKNSNIAGFVNPNAGWMTVFWNNKENGKKMINSSTIYANSERFARNENVDTCSNQGQVKNAAVCYLPTNNGHILLWEEGTHIGGHLVKDDTFKSALDEQQRPQILYNQREKKAFVVWKQKDGGRFVLFVRNIHPGSQFSCRVPCKSNQKCAMKDVCAPRSPGAIKNTPSCAKNNGGCSHNCLRNVKGRKCNCPWSYTLALDQMKCYLKGERPDVSLLYASKGSVWSVSVYYKSNRTTYTRIPIQGQVIISFSYNKKDKYLYWADATEGKIYKAFLDGSNKRVIITNQVAVPDGMIVDADAQQLYWSDAAYGTISRCSLDGSNRVNFLSNLDKPRALALYQKKKWLFWTNWGTVAKIERINSDGSNRRVLFDTGLKWPNGMAIDGSKLYWADAMLDKIEMSDLNGKNRVMVTKKGLVHPYGLDIAGSRLYWTDWAGDIRSFDKSKPSSSPEVIVQGIQKPFEIQIYDGTALTQAAFCMDPGVPRNGGRNPSPGTGGKYKVADRIVLTCNPGFVHLGSNERECLSTGQWTGTDTKCKVLPVFTIRPTNKTVDTNSKVTLECAAEVKPGVKASIKWYKNNKPIPPSASGRYFQLSGQGFFYINNVVASDAGTYTCIATNDAGEIRASMFLLVNPSIVGNCGKAKFAARGKIIGGKRARHGSIPWQVLLWNKQKKKPFCGASLLNTQWAITAAHCFNHFQLSDIKVILGEHDWKVHEKTEQDFSVHQLYLHPHYDSKTFDSDIALIKFTKTAILNDYIKPICLPTSKSDLALLKPKSIGRISGWGSRKSGKLHTVKKLHTVLVPLVSFAKCKKSHPEYHVTSNMFCAGHADGKGDACQGDSGGPLTIENAKTGRSVLIGIVSWGEKCGLKGKYGVYTKVQRFVHWIKKTIENN